MALSGSTWKPLQVPPIRSLPAPVYVRVERIPPRHRFPAHKHRWNQFIYAISGTLTVVVGRQWFVIGPEQAVWIPTGTVHEVASTYGAEFRSLYVDNAAGVVMPASYSVLAVTPLLRELIVEAVRIGGDLHDSAYKSAVLGLISGHLPRLASMDMSLPWPHTGMLQGLCETLYLAPADTRSISAWGRQLGASSRTLSRRFQDEVGISFREWKRRLRLVKSLELLGAGMSVTATALELGYNSTSAFSYMFTRAMGYSPKEHLGQP